MGPSEYNPKTLADVWQLPPGAFLEGQRMLPQMQARDQHQMDKSLQDMQFDAEQQPHRIQQYQDQSAAAAAQLPGHQANSRTAVRNDGEHAMFAPDRVRSQMGKYTVDHVKQIEGFGQAAMQAGAEVRFNPLGAAQRIRERFAKMGMGQLWDPSFDTLPPEQLAAKLDALGQGIQKATPKLYGQLELEGTKQEGKKEIAELNAANRTQIANIRANAAKIARDAKADGSPKTWQAAAAQYGTAASEAEMAGNTEIAQVLRAHERHFIQQAQNAILIRAQATQAGQPDAGAITGLPTKPSVPPVPEIGPRVPQGAVPAPPAPPASNGIASPASKADFDKLPSGTRFKAPDGSIRVKP